jgi:hypothetical protein
MSIFTSSTQMSLFVDNMYENTYNVAANGYLEIYDTEDTNYEEQYNLIPGAQTSMTAANVNWYMAFFALTFCSILSLLAFKKEIFYVLAGFGWMTTSLFVIQDIQATFALIGLGVGVFFMLWGVYRYFT